VADTQFHPEAQAEYQAALLWYQARSPQAGTRFETEVGRVPASVSAGPESALKYDDEHCFAVLRRFPYAVVFQTQPDSTYVVAVAHSSRSPDYWQGRE